MRTLMWFRSDLRVEDNTALSEACRAADEGVVGVFTICPEQWREHDWGGPKVDFLLRNLAELRDRLETLSIPLRVVRTDCFDGVAEKIVKLAHACACGALYFNREYEVNEQRRDDDVSDACEDAGIKVHDFDDQVMLDPTLPRTGEGKYYSVYTPFKRKWLSHYKDEAYETRPTPQKQADTGIDADDVPATVKGFSSHVDPELWPAGEKSAKLRLSAFIKHRVGDYEEQRDDPSDGGTSSLSPYLALGVVSARMCMDRAIEANGGEAALDGEGAASWMNELVWREFYKHVLVGFPRVCMGKPFQEKTERVEWAEDDALFEAWCEGRTGFPIVDAGMRQLNEIGWMHNRLRMIVAMVLTKDLFIDWRRGERYFNQRLVDCDFASNNGGWQWSASTGTDAQPYFRVFNPFSQSKRYDADGVYIKRWVPELEGVPAKALHDEKKLAEARERLGIDYPAPIVDRSKTRDRVMKVFKAL